MMCTFFDRQFNITNTYLNQIFQIACANGYLDIVEYLYKTNPKININVCDDYDFISM